MTRTGLLLSTTALVLAASQASAQTSIPAGATATDPAAPSQAAPAGAQASPDMGDIIVTAQKRSESLQNVGIAITALTGDDLQSRGVVSVQNLPDLSPGLRMESPGGPANATFTIRGVGQRDIADQNEGAVVVFRDGAYVPFLSAATMPLYDLERVEVLKGPQGTLFGRNATGGLIQLISRKPGATWDGYGQMTIGSYQEIGYEGAVGGPITDDLGIRAAVYTRRNDGFVKNRVGRDVESLENYSGRVTLRYAPRSGIDATLIGYFSRYENSVPRGHDQTPLVQNADGSIRRPTSRADFQAFCAATFPLAPAFGLPLAPAGSETRGNCFTAEDNNPYTVSINDNTNFNNRYYGTTGTLNVDLTSNVTLTSVTDYQSFKKVYTSDVDGTPVYHLFHFDTTFDGDNFSQELRLTGRADRLNWSVGGYYLNVDAAGTVVTGTINNPALLADFGTAFRQKTRSWAGFAQADYALTDQLKLTLGGRYTHDRKTLSNAGTCTGNPIFGFVPAGAIAPGLPATTLPICTFYQTFVFPNSLQFRGFNGGFTKGSWNYKGQFDWKPTGDLLVYAGVTRGTKSGGFNTGGGQFYDLASVPYRGETLTAYEGGVKLTLRNLRTTINASVFYYDYNDYQSYLVVGGFLRTLNVDATVRGGELEIASRPVENLRLNVGVSYLDGRQQDVPLPAGGFADFVMPNAPKWSLNGLIGYDVPLGGDAKLGFQVDGAYVTSRTANAIDYAAIRLPSYFRGNGRVTLAASDRIDLSVIVNNFTNKRIPLIRVNAATLTGASADVYDRPRWFQGQVTYRF